MKTRLPRFIRKSLPLFFSIILFSLFSNNAIAQTPFLVKNINTQPTIVNSSPRHFIQIGSTTYFTATTRNEGTELWKTDGTPGGTTLLKDIRPGSRSGLEYLNLVLANVDGTLFFRANDGRNGHELWKSDGTTSGTVLVKNTKPGASGSLLKELTNVDGTLFFTTHDHTHGWELWKSDGTSAGTALVKDINPGTGSSSPKELINVGGTLFFLAHEPTNGYELWKSDGTSAGTVLVKDLRPGPESGFGGTGSPEFTNVGGTLFFSQGGHLWKSDGTASGTVVVEDISPERFSGNPRDLIDVDGTLFFFANVHAVGWGLWKSDGTAAGTVMVKDIEPGFGSNLSRDFANVNGTLFFRANDGINGKELWKSDGTTAGTVMVKDIYPGIADSSPEDLENVDETLFFRAEDGIHGEELWKSDGTAAGTVLVKDIRQGSDDSGPNELFNADGTLIFSAYGETNGRELWKSDGTASGTILLNNIGVDEGSSYPQNLINAGGKLFFSADDGTGGRELWKSDGTSAGTTLVKDIRPGLEDSFHRWREYQSLKNVGGMLFFTASDGISGNELWKSDGTPDGTVLVKDINPGSVGSLPQEFTDVNGTLFFAAHDAWNGYTPIDGHELWRSDGTAAGTVMVKDINLGVNGSSPVELVNVDGTLFFNAFDGIHGRELWKSDGTASGTVLVKDIRPGIGGSSPQQLVNIDGTLFFSTYDLTNGSEIWKSDGTAAGTVLLKDNLDGFPQQFTDVDGTLFFSADDGTNGYELWKSDGTSAGTMMVKDIRPGPETSFPLELTNMNGTLFFSAEDGTNGYELWKSDGTSAGTVMVKDILPGAGNGFPRDLINKNGALFFTASDEMNGQELWKSDGTTAGTVRLPDIAPGLSSSNAQELTVVGSTVFLSANNGFIGQELWTVSLLKNPVRNDFDGDGDSDVLAVHDSGILVSALVENSIFQNSGFLLQADPAAGWTVNATGDFNGDKKADLLLYNTTTGEYRTILLDGTTVLSDTVVFTIDPVIGVEPRGVGDFDGDGEDEIILYHPPSGFTGLVYLASGAFSSFEEATTIDVANNWTLKDTGHFNNDNKTDLLITNTVTGESTVIEMDGSVATGPTSIFTFDPATGWSVKNTGDFNGDGKTDVVILHTSGALGVLIMDGLALQSFYVPGGLSPGWELVNVGNYNSDNKADFLIHDTNTGDLMTAVQDGATVTAYTPVLNLGVGSGWSYHGGKP